MFPMHIKGLGVLLKITAVLGFLLSVLPVNGWSAKQLPYHGKVVQAVDGSTLLLNTGQRIHLYAIRVLPGKEIEARQGLQSLVLNKTVTLDYPSREPDRFGRTFAYVFIDNRKTLINKRVVENGWAEISETPSDNYYKKLLLGAGTVKDEKHSGGYAELEAYETLLNERKGMMTRQIYLAWGVLAAAVVLGIYLRVKNK